MTKIIHLQSNDPLVGDWVPADLYSDIVISISKDESEYKVSVFDSNDDEQAEVYEINYDGTELSFNVHWASNGRFIKYGLLVSANNIVRLFYTYSGQETWVRKETVL
ncbi:hypothetical protein MIB92_18705 [Aestuariirhabdus sp. Z084]|uniref:hypothetical protein n=1 Tax=Aestuariirhabdus haliotis TaxID=2918751 RepID=UPI00201B4522|nr:hypothetical protein [Aestuariirhabdus haliotis]MCL6417697.1 hypothetical protein [Aestuariirhabdus haliotis]MCL6421646.1 hypothetical protein [Aestuariirhabdus haliotis]